jgi:hypothetical protein
LARQFNRIYDLQVGIPAGSTISTEVEQTSGVDAGQVTTVVTEVPGAGFGISITELQMTFNINLTASSSPNTCTITVTNLNSENRAKLNRNKAVVLKVGYKEQGLTTLFTGTIFSFSSVQKGTDIVTTIQVGDGYTPLVNKTICDVRSGTVESLITFLAGKLGVPIGTLSNGDLGSGKGLLRVYDKENPYVLSGKIKSALDKIAKGNKLEWYIEAGSLIVTPLGGLRLEPEIQVESGTGLVGSPSSASQNLSGKKKEDDTVDTKSSNGIKFETLIEPRFGIGRRARITSKFYDKVSVRVTKVTHKGDFRGKSWTTQVEAEIINNE